MKVTVCELSNDMAVLAQQWAALAAHVAENSSDLVLLPEMPFYRWLSHNSEFEAQEWATAVVQHTTWLKRFSDLAPALVAGTRPINKDGKRHNEAFIWGQDSGYQAVHHKYYLPEEPEFWEASWYERGAGEFVPIDTPLGRIGFLICTEIWFFQHARSFAKEGVQLLLNPRATPINTADKWVAGGRAAAVVSGAYCLSSNLGRNGAGGLDYAGAGWIIEPQEGAVLGITSADQPFLTVEIETAVADHAKQTYPRYVLD